MLRSGRLEKYLSSFKNNSLETNALAYSERRRKKFCNTHTPDWIGNLKDLVHLEASVNHIDFVSDKIANCKLVQELALSTNDLRSLPEAIGGLESLVTLKLDDNQVRKSAFSLPPDFNP